jgi:hypothetical protein
MRGNLITPALFPMLHDSHKLEIKQVLDHFQNNSEKGLNNDQVKRQSEAFGPNGIFESHFAFN